MSSIFSVAARRSRGGAALPRGAGGLGALALLALLLALLLAPALARATDLGSGRLLVAGTRLTVSPEAQTVPFDTPTIVETHLEGFDAASGALPSDLRVLADFTGPEVDGVLRLETVPNEPFRIPRLSLKGQYQLDNIRLVQGEELLAYAEPRSAGVLVTQILITRVTSRPLTLDEIRSYGIVVDGGSFKAFNFTFGFGVQGETVSYDVPVVWVPTGEPPFIAGGVESGGSGHRFMPPQLAPFFLYPTGGSAASTGGCESPDGDCAVEDPPPLPGVILFPTDFGVLNQFFSVLLMVQNGAPAGDPLVVRDLTATLHLPAGLRQAQTEPPTPLGVPVPVRVPGPDGELGTADDVTFLVAQASGEADFLVEGLKQGTHVVEMDLSGTLDGLPGGVRHVGGQARGVVVVRDPTFGVTISHPDVVRRGEEYTLRLTVANTSNAPANLVTISLPASRLTGVELVDPAANRRTFDTLLPGQSEVADFRLRALATGRVVAASARSDSAITPTFELTTGVGENGVPLSPDEIVLPHATEALPAALVDHALGLIGLGFSLATAPPALLGPDLPPVTRAAVDGRVYQLAQAGRVVGLGEELFDAAAVLAAEWNGARDADWDWDTLRRTTQKGALFGDSLGQVFAAEAASTGAEAAFDRFVATTAFLPPLGAALGAGPGVEIEVASRTSGKLVAGAGTALDRERDLPFADLYDLGSAEMALLGVPEGGGYQVRLTSPQGAAADLDLLVTGPGPQLTVYRWHGVPLGAAGRAVADFGATLGTPTLYLDADGDTIVDQQLAPAVDVVAPRPFHAVGAVENAAADPTGHVVDVLFSGDVDLGSLIPSDPGHFTLPGKVSNGGLIPTEQDAYLIPPVLGGEPVRENAFRGLRNDRIVEVVLDNPLSPYVEQPLTVDGVASVLGEAVASQTLAVATTVTTPGILVEGQVFGPDGQPVPFAEVTLRESDYNVLKNECVTHATAAVRADASGHFLFDYVRQTECGGVFTLEGRDPATDKRGKAAGRVRFIGQTARLDIVMVGRGLVRGRVLYDDGTAPRQLKVVAQNPVFREGRLATVDAAGNYEVGDLPVGTIDLSASDGLGNFALTTIAIPSSGAVVVRDLTILRQPDQPTGDLRGTVYGADGETPVFNAWVALYLGGSFVTVRRSSPDGSFDFGTVPAGTAEIEAFDPETGRSGAEIFFTVEPDRVNEISILLADERGSVEGTVYRRQPNGALTPVQGAVVYAFQTPFHTVSAGDGSYRLEDVFAGNHTLRAVDLATNQVASGSVTVAADGSTASRDLIFEDSTPGGIGGVVTDYGGAPVGGATVHLGVDDQHWAFETFTDGAGAFTLSGLAPGSYLVHAFRGADGGTARVEVRFAGDTPFAEVRFKKGTIRGVVEARNESGDLVGARSIVRYRTTVVRLGLVGLDVESHDLETADDGSFELADVLAGDYRLTVFNSFYGSKAVTGTLVANGEVATHEIIFERNGDIAGTVLDRDGVTPLAGARVDLRHPAFGDYHLTADADGRFDFELVPPATHPFAVDAMIDDGLVYRKARVWVRFDQPNQHLDLELVMPEQGMVSGRVEDSEGNPVPRAAVSLRESAYPNELLTQEADDDGAFAFTNVFAGMATVSASSPALGGLGGKTTVTLTHEGEEVSGVVVRLQDVGEIDCRVIDPTDGQPVPSAEVQLYRGGLFDSATTDGEGTASFVLLPLDTYTLVAFDPMSGRQGRQSGLVVGANGQVVSVDLVLEARGDVDGHLYEPLSSTPVPGATVTLHTRSLVPITTYSSTDADGYFELLGIPQGELTLSAREPQGRRRASATGEIVHEGDRVTIDLYLEQSGSVSGSVLAPAGQPDGPFSPTDVRLYQDGQLIGASLDNPYHFTGIIAGRSFELDASEPGGGHAGSATGRLDVEGQDVALDVRMQPIGSVVVTVVDSDGQPVSGAAVDLTSYGFYATRHFSAGTGADNQVTFSGVGGGRLSVFARDPVSQLGGSATAQLDLDGQTAAVEVMLQDSGEVRGTIVDSDGATPAAGALAVLTHATTAYDGLAAADGSFSFAAVPLGAFSLDFQQSFGPGQLRVTGTVAANGQVVDLGTLVLDDSDPTVVSVAPANGATGVGVGVPVVAHFSEPLDASRFATNWLTLRKLGQPANVTADFSFADGDSTLILQPRQPLQSFTSYQVRVTHFVLDPAGRALAEEVQTTFTTADVVAPAIVQVTPADGAVQVPVDTQLDLLFSEPVDAASLSGPALALTDTTAGAGVGTTFTALAGGREVLLTPVSLLAADHAFELAVQGVRDLAGNVMAPFTSRFSTLDATPPVVEISVPAGPLEEGVAYALSATPVASPDVASVSFFDGASLIGTATAAPFSVSYTPSAADAAAGSVELSAAAVDLSGNVGPSSSATREVSPNPPPAVDLALDPPVQILPEHLFTVSGAATDATGLSQVKLVVSGAASETRTYSPNGATSQTFTRSYTLPTHPSASYLRVSVTATDVRGKVTQTAPVDVAVLADVTAPVISAVEPPDGTAVTSGDLVTASAQVTDDVRVVSVTFRLGDQSFTATAPPYAWTAAVPAVEAPTDLPLTLEAVDPYGNTATATVTLAVQPFVDPGIPTVAITCPTDGALLAPTTSLGVAIDAADDEGVEKVELFLDPDPTPVATLFTPPYAYTLTAPAGAADGDLLHLRAVVHDFAGHSAEDTVTVEVVAGALITGTRTVSPTDTTYEGQTVVVRGTNVTLTVDGPHAFRDLVVLDGAKVTHSPTTATGGERSLDLTLTRDLYVACGGTIDTTGLGYRSRTGYGNTGAEAPTSGHGASHAGRGGSYDGSSPVYGSLFDPADPGAGAGTFGGGVVRVSAGGAVVVDGSIKADGASFVGSDGAAGGSIRLAAGAISGAGVVEAAGSATSTATTPGGSGGRVALYASTIAPGLLSRTRAWGTRLIASAALGNFAAAGTIFALDGAGTHGTLIVDNGGSPALQPTELLAVGHGTVGSVGPDSITDPAADFRHGLAGAEVAFDGDLAETWPVVANAHHGQTLTLGVAGHPLTAAPGAAYRGLYHFDRVVVRGGARLVSRDLVVSDAPPEVEAGSLLLAGDDTAAPQLDVSFAPAAEVLPNRSLVVWLYGADASGLAGLHVTLAGAAAADQSFTASGTAALWGPSFFLPPALASTAAQTIEVTARATGADGQTTEVTRTVTVLPDTTPPAVTGFTPAAGTAVTSGGTISVSLTTTDDVSLASATLDLGERSFPMTLGAGVTSRTFTWTNLFVPPVAAAGPLPVTVRITDWAGNLTTQTWSLAAQPSADAVPPVLGLSCPGSVVVSKAGSALRLDGQASDETRLYKLAFAIGAGAPPAVVLYPSQATTSFTQTLTVPAGAADGDVVPVTVEATDFGGHQTAFPIAVHVLSGVTIASNTTIGAGDSSLDGQSLIVASGTLTLDGTHDLRDLVILPGATVTHPATDAAAEHRLELHLARDLYVACSGTSTAKLDASRRGYLYGAAGARAWGYGNSQAEGADADQGGSHGGYGGRFDGASGGIYGSLFDPKAPGAGGGYDATVRGGTGGGVVRVSAAGAVAIDGLLLADGESTIGAGGAGGSIRLDGATIGGAGQVHALGGNAGRAAAGGGSGGRIALYGAAIEDGLLSRTLAAGGISPALDTSFQGAAGTIFARRDAQALGDLIIDNSTTGAFGSTQPTLLPSVGYGIVDAVGPSSVTDLEADFRADLAGIEVVFNHDLAHPWTITGNAYHGQTLDLDVAGNPLTAQPGDSYLGLYRFDHLIVRGRARAEADDYVDTGEPPEVAADSSFAGANLGPPVVDVSRLGFELGLFGPVVVGAPGAVTDLDPPLTVTLTNSSTGAETTLVADPDGSFRGDVDASPGDTFQVVATDSHRAPLASPPAVVGPVAPGVSRRASVAVPDLVPTDLAIDGERMVLFADAQGDPPTSLLAAVDLGDPFAPVVSATFDLGGEHDAMPGSLRLEDGVAAFVGFGGFDVVVVDLRDPAAPAFDPVADDLVPFADSSARAIDLEGGLLWVIGASPDGSPSLPYAVYDVHDPLAPVLVASGSLAAADGPVALVVQGGLLHLLSAEGGAGLGEYRLFSVADPAAPVLVTASDVGAEDRTDARALAVVGEVAVFTGLAPGAEVQESYIATLRSDQAATEAPHVVSTLGGGTQWDAVLEAGERLLFSTVDGQAAVGRLDSSPATHGVTLEETAWLPPTGAGSGARRLLAGRGLLWRLDDAGEVTGLPSRLLRPWIEPGRVSFTRSASGVDVVGAAGAVEAEEAGVTATVELAAAAGTASAPVAADGSFSLSLAGVEVGDPLTLQAADDLGRRGDLVRRPVPPAETTGPSFLSMPEGIDLEP